MTAGPILFTRRGPAVSDGDAAFVEVGIGFEHELVTAGEETTVQLTLDADGQPIPRLYRLPVAVTAAQAIDAMRRVHDTLARHGIDLDADPTAARGLVEPREDMGLELMVAMLGDETLMQIASDPTVHPEDFEELCLMLLDVWGFGPLLDELFGALEKARGAKQGAGADPLS